MAIAGDSVFAVSLTLALSGAAVSQHIKLPELDCALAGCRQTSPGSGRGAMGFCGGECAATGPAGWTITGACRAGWVGPTVLLCIYGLCSVMRPAEAFMTEFLTETYKNLTTELEEKMMVLPSFVWVIRQLYPMWTYSSLVLLVLFLLVTDFHRYSSCRASPMSRPTCWRWLARPAPPMQPHNFTVDAVSTLSGAAAAVAVGRMSPDWSVWWELVLGGFPFLIAGTVFLMDLADSIWISYTFFFLFKPL